MAITEADIVLLESERLTDADDGGGLRTSNVVPDGTVNNLFSDISRLDRVYGRVNLRKIYAGVNNALTDTYLGSHMIVSAPPADGNVHATIFSTDSHSDERLDAQTHIESYLVASTPAQFYLLGNHLTGQRTVAVYQRESDDLPEIGATYALSVESGVSAGQVQFVRVSGLSSEVRTFSELVGGQPVDFDRRVVTLSISAPLLNDFPGEDPSQVPGGDTIIRDTTVASAAKYYGISSLAADVSAGSATVTATSIYTPLVPSTTAETAVIDQLPALDAGQMVVCGSAATDRLWHYITDGGGTAITGTLNLYMPLGVLPGELDLTIQVSGTVYASALTDDGLGGIVVSAGASAVLGSNDAEIDYATGVISNVTILSGAVQIIDANHAPAVAPATLTETRQIEITAVNRGYTYVTGLDPLPSPGALSIDFMALGKWYTITDDAAGGLVGNGGGTVNYSTGSLAITLDALPDIGSSIIIRWGASVYYTDRSSTSVAAPTITWTLGDTGIEPGSLSLSWAGGAKTATDDGAGAITGDGSGVIDYATGTLELYPSIVPAAGTLSASYNEAGSGGGVTTDTFPSLVPDGSGFVTFTLTGIPLQSGTVSVAWQTSHTDPNTGDTVTTNHSARDDGAGGFVGLGVGSTVNYTTGAITLEVNGTRAYTVATAWPNVTTTDNQTIDDELAGAVTAQYMPTGVGTAASSDSTTIDTLTIDLAPDHIEALVSGSLMWTWGTKRYLTSGGNVITDYNAATGAGTTVGTISHSAGVATITTFPDGETNSITLQSALSVSTERLTSGVIFRCPGAPIASGGLYIQATQPDGTTVSATADSNGDLSASGLVGHIDYETGIAVVEFGQRVDETTLTPAQRLEWWYDADNIADDGTILIPDPVLPETISYNCVVLTNLPLDADLLGLDPVRLPPDGQVPMFLPGDVAVVHDTDEDTMPNPLSAGQVVALTRSSLDSVRIVDADGDEVTSDKYSVDLDAGEVTMANPLDLSAYSQPLVARHTIADMVLVTDVQITGQIGIASPLAHSYTAANSFISGALTFGDLQARVTNLFDQETWTGIWGNSAAEAGTVEVSTAEYDDTNYPVEVSNDGSEQDRWALIFQSTTTVDVVSEIRGTVLAGASILGDISPTNSLTGNPYFTIRLDGWGSGWSTGDVLRFNTVAAFAPVWVTRTTLNGPPSVADDRFTLQTRGDAE